MPFPSVPQMVVDRVAISLPEARLDHGLSRRALAELSGVPESTIRKAESGGQVDPALLVRLATALVILDLYQPQHLETDVDGLLVGAMSARWAA